MGAAAAESKDRVIDQANEEYEAYTAGKLYRRLGTTDAPGGEVEYCGDEDDPAQWTVAYVRARDNAILPLTCGDRDRALEDFRRIDRSDVAFWSDYDCPPPVLLADGIRHFFQPARGRVLLGVVELAGRTVLLVAAGTRLVAVHRAGGVSTLLPLGRPSTIREVDLDHLLAYYGPRAVARQKPKDEPLRPSPRTRAHHLRIVRGRPVDVGAGPRLSEVLSAIFEDIEVRATAPKDRPRGKRLKGKSWVPRVLTYLRKLCVLGCRDLVGLTSQIIAQIQRRFPEFKITAEAFADALKLIAATGTGLIAPRGPRGRIWRIRLEALADPTSVLHKRLCCETAGRPGVDEAANQEPSDPTPRGRVNTPAGAPGPSRGGKVVESASGHDDGAHARGSSEAAAQEASSVEGGAERGSAASVPLVDADIAASPAPSAAHGAIGSIEGSTAPGEATGDLADPRHAAAFRLVDQLSQSPLAGPLLLLWALHAQEDAQAASGIEPVAANDLERPKPVTEVDGGEPQPKREADVLVADANPEHVEAGGPDAPNDLEQMQDPVAEVDGGEQAQRGPEVDVPVADADSDHADDPIVVDVAGDEEEASCAGAGEGGTQQADFTPKLVDDLGLPDAAEYPVGIDGDEGRGDDGAPAVRDAPLAGAARKRPARRPRRRAWARQNLAAWFVGRATRRAADLGTLGPRGPPAWTSG